MARVVEGSHAALVAAEAAWAALQIARALEALVSDAHRVGCADPAASTAVGAETWN